MTLWDKAALDRYEANIDIRADATPASTKHSPAQTSICHPGAELLPLKSEEGLFAFGAGASDGATSESWSLTSLGMDFCFGAVGGLAFA